MSRQVLGAGWQLARVDADGGLAGTWHDLPRRLPLAAALRHVEGWQPGADARDLDAETWMWRVCFDRPDATGADAIWLGLDGLATWCDVSLNGEPLLGSRNMFHQHRVEVGARLAAHGNELRILAHALADDVRQRRPRPRWKVPMLRQQQWRWWRTSLLGRMPGWSPPTPAVGPWREVWIGDEYATLTERLWLRPRLDGDDGLLEARLAAAPEGRWRLRLSRQAQIHEMALQRQADGSARGQLRIPNVARWWPHTHGEPACYDAALLREPADVESPSPARNWPLHPIGFRTVRWNRSGGDFALSVNGVPVFARGACWMPLDVLDPHAEASRVDEAVAEVARAGLNMLRVCGPTVYESDAFADACDRRGVLVWQDLMFANMDYPAADDAWRASVRDEVHQQAMRWQGRPSLALLCGNSEVSQQAAMMGAPRELWTPDFFEHELPAWARRDLPDADYCPSSSHGADLPHAPQDGSSSYYGVGAYRRPLDDARSSGLRFASECLGFAQMPEPSALDRMPDGHALHTHHPAWKAAVPRDLGAGWDFEDVRDHYLAEQFGVSPTALRRSDPARYARLSRAVIARVMEETFSRWRSAGSGCRGALVWTLKDWVPGAGWGLWDDAGEPKSAWYALKRVLQPVAVLFTDDGLNGLTLHLVNDRAQAAEVELELAVYHRGQCREHRRVARTLPPHSVQALPAQSLLPHALDLSWAYRFGPPVADLVQARLLDGEGRVISRAHHLCGGWAQAAAVDDSGLQATLKLVDDRTLQLELQARLHALSVQIELPGWRAEDAYFDLAPGECRQVLLQARSPRPTTRPRGSVQPAHASWPTAIALERDVVPA